MSIEHNDYQLKSKRVMKYMVRVLGINSQPTFPHCDPFVLHAPDKGCKFCNESGLQSRRVEAGMNFTFESDPLKLPDPAEMMRPAEVFDRWPGNKVVAR